MGDNIKKGFQETEWGLDVTQDREKCRALLSTTLNLRVP
jgi:hypothetical protein